VPNEVYGEHRPATRLQLRGNHPPGLQIGTYAVH